MSSFAPAAKRPKTGAKASENGEAFPDIGPIVYKPDAKADDLLCFRYYNAKEKIHGKTMEEWLRFSVCYWHTFRGTGADPFGYPTLIRPWEDGDNPMEIAKARMRAAFEFFSKLGIKYWTFHDRDIAPEGDTLEETNRNLDEISDLALELQKKYDIKLLWGTANLFAHPRYMNGAGTNPDPHSLAYAGAQVKKMLEITKKLGGVNFVFWGGREGYQTILNTDVKRELDHMAALFRMAVAYKEKIGFTGQLLIEPKPKEPTKHQYDYDAQTVIGFLKTYGLDGHFKLNIEPNHTTLAGHGYEHDVIMASKLGFLGSVDSNTGSPDLGWDTDQFPMDVKAATLVMKVVSTLTAKFVVSRSTDLSDMFFSHIGAMDTFAGGLRNAVKIVDEGLLDAAIKMRYSGFDKGISKKIEDGSTSLQELEKYILEHGEPAVLYVRKAGVV